MAWRGRVSGRSKLALQEMGSRYLFIILIVFLEHHLTRGDYRRTGFAEQPRRGELRSRAARKAAARDGGGDAESPDATMADH